MPVKRVEIPKPGGGVRLLGIPTVMDRALREIRPVDSTQTTYVSLEAVETGTHPKRKG